MQWTPSWPNCCANCNLTLSFGLLLPSISNHSENKEGDHQAHLQSLFAILLARFRLEHLLERRQVDPERAIDTRLGRVDETQETETRLLKLNGLDAIGQEILVGQQREKGRNVGIGMCHVLDLGVPDGVDCSSGSQHARLWVSGQLVEQATCRRTADRRYK